MNTLASEWQVTAHHFSKSKSNLFGLEWFLQHFNRNWRLGAAITRRRKWTSQQGFIFIILYSMCWSRVQFHCQCGGKIQSGIPKINAHAVENLNFFPNRAGNQRATCESWVPRLVPENMVWLQIIRVVTGCKLPLSFWLKHAFSKVWQHESGRS